jgi:hypothetical protein
MLLLVVMIFIENLRGLRTQISAATFELHQLQNAALLNG